MRVIATGWTLSSLGVRSPGLRFRQIVLVLSVGYVRRCSINEAAHCGTVGKGIGGLCQLFQWETVDDKVGELASAWEEPERR